MLGQRGIRWANIDPTSERLMFQGVHVNTGHVECVHWSDLVIFLYGHHKDVSRVHDTKNTARPLSEWCNFTTCVKTIILTED